MLLRGQLPNLRLLRLLHLLRLLRLLRRWAAAGLEGHLKEVAPVVEGYPRPEEDRGVEEALVEEEGLQEPRVVPEELEEQELKRNNR